MTNEFPDGDDFVGDEATDDVATWDADGSLDDVGDDVWSTNARPERKGGISNKAKR